MRIKACEFSREAIEFAAGKYRAEVPDRRPGAGTWHGDSAQTQGQLADIAATPSMTVDLRTVAPLFEAVEVA